METIDYYDKPDYDKLIKILEKAKETIPFYPKNKSQNTLVDQEVTLKCFFTFKIVIWDGSNVHEVQWEFDQA